MPRDQFRWRHPVMAIHLVVTAITVLVWPCRSFSQVEEAPSFPCEKPTSVEKIICGDKALAALDRQVSELYSRLLAASSDHAKAYLKTEQRKWVKGRNSCDGTQPPHMRDDRTCIEKYYRWNLSWLAPQALFADHELALSVLTRVLPETSPLYEAIYVYASVQDSNERRGRLEAVLTPALHDLKQKPSGYAFKDFNSASDIIVNDDAFANFIGMASALVEQGGVPMTLPCQAIIKRPVLIKAVGPKFSGALDAWVIQDNCGEVLPATPRFTELARETLAAQKTCSGTVRFSLAREQAQLLLAIRLHDLGAAPVPTPNQNAAAFKASHMKAMEETQHELTLDNISTFGLAPDSADADARRAVQLLIDRTFENWQGCGVG